MVLGLLVITNLNMSDSHDSFTAEMLPDVAIISEESELEALRRDVVRNFLRVMMKNKGRQLL